jgi:hypothetical protein
VKASVPGKGVCYRVRIGKFPSRQSARDYAERLRHSGLLDQYFIFAYDPPSKSEPSAPPLAAPAPQLTQAGRDAIILVASRNWSARAPTGVAMRSAPVSLPSLAAASQPRLPLTPPRLMALPEMAAVVPPPPPRASRATNMPRLPLNPAVARAEAPPVTKPAERPRPAPANPREAPVLEPPLLRGVIESNNGQLQLRLQNLDARQSFKGVARVTLGEGQQQSEAAPVQVALQPNEERIFFLTPTQIRSGSYTMMVYDAEGAVRLIRGASLGPGSGSAPRVLHAPEEPAVAAAGPPAENDITVVPRQIGATPENVTIEFEITSQRPLGYVSLLLHAANLTDVRRAVLTTTNGRIPFLVPVRGTETTFSYELRDDSDRVLVSGEDDLRRLAQNRP